jgi:pimeloyl-ACP methyl ester carboxylesterase
MHAGISGRVFDSIGPSATPTRTIHDGLTRAIYSGVDRGIRGAAHVAGIIAAEVWGNESDEALESRTDATAAAIAAVNGIYGDVLTEQGSPLAGAMTIRCGDKPVALTTEALAEAYPAATNRVAVFVHGWCLTERSWSRRPVEAEDGRSYGERLREDLGYSPIFLRYNTGLHVSANGRTLGEILELLHDQWPVPISELVLVGHSMGGLVARSACHYGAERQHGWTNAVSRVVCLGSPHLGADLEKGVHIASWALARLPETRAIATFLNTRSDGVKDLRFGACLDEDWRDADPDEFLRDRCQEAPFLPHADGARVDRRRSPCPFEKRCGPWQVTTHSVRARARADADRVESLRLAQSPTGVREVARLAGPLTRAVGPRRRYEQRRLRRRLASRRR